MVTGCDVVFDVRVVLVVVIVNLYLCICRHEKILLFKVGTIYYIKTSSNNVIFLSDTSL